MKLTGLSDNLKGNDKSLSNSYLQHIVELLRNELATLTAKETALETTVTDHIEGQEEEVDTKVVKATQVQADEAIVNTIEAKSLESRISMLNNAIEAFANDFTFNGKRVLTEDAFEGPFTYRGEVETLPETAEAGDVYIVGTSVEVYNGTSWDEFTMPIGTVAESTYQADQATLSARLATDEGNISDNTEKITELDTKVTAEIAEQNEKIETLQTAVENKVDEAPEDGKSYVRKDKTWTELSEAENTVASTAGESVITNTEEGVTITSPRVSITSEDIKVNDKALTEYSKLGLSKTSGTSDNDYYYELKYDRSPFSPISSNQFGYTIYADSDRFATKNNLNQKWTVTTKDYQYRKSCNQYLWADNSQTVLTSMDKDGNIKPMYFPSRQLVDTQGRNYIMDWLVWNPEYCPEGFENKAYLFVAWTYDTGDNKAYLLEYDNGEYVKSYDLTDEITGQGYTLQTSLNGYWNYEGEGGKSLRSKDIQRICWISHDADAGGTYAVILGGDEESEVTDPFDPTKCIYVKLPATAVPGYTSMAATDKAWYLTEYKTGRLIRITPNGSVLEYNLSSTSMVASTGDYIEYTDKNKRPACAFRVFADSTGGKEAIVFFEEKEDGGVNFEEVDMTPYVFNGWDSSLWRMCENDYYIFFVPGFGFAYNQNENGFPAVADVKKMFYWDKQTHTTHIIDDFYGIAATTWTHADTVMLKTKGNAIWFVPHIQDLTAAQRTGELKYITNTDYTDIDEDTGKDVGSIEVQTASIGTDYPWFTCNNSFGWDNYTMCFLDTSSWAYTSISKRMAAVNDDGIGFIMSPDYKAFALFYGDGNIQVYKIGKEGKEYRFDPNVQQMLPDELDNQATCLSMVEGLKHGWLIRARGYQNTIGYYDVTRTNADLVYIGIIYHNGEPTILQRPQITILRNHNDEYCRPKHKYEFYSYLLTYDDYERRNKIMRGTFMDIAYGWPTRGIDGYYKEVAHNNKDKLNLTYDGEVISSVEE